MENPTPSSQAPPSAARREKPVGTENQFQFVFPAPDSGKIVDEGSGKARERGKLKISNSEPERAQFASDLARRWYFPIFRHFSTGQPAIVVISGVQQQQQVRRLPENSRVPNSLKCSENSSRKITTWERSEKLKCKRRKKSSSQEQVKKCKFFQLFRKILPPVQFERRKVSLNSWSASKFSRPQLRK